jgi:thioredoxin-related protein
MRLHPFLLLVLLTVSPLPVLGAEGSDDAYPFDDSMLEEELVYPEWFKLSFGDLRKDLEEALAAGKKGIVVYFGQKRCSYCEQFLEKDLGQADIVSYMRRNFDVIPIDIWDIDDIIDTDGTEQSERELALKYQTNFTPSLVFYDENGKPVFRLRGFYPPYKFRAALKYVAEKFYEEETFRDYLARAEPGMFFYTEGLNERDFFMEEPDSLDRTQAPGEKPLVVFFEKGDCHACDLLHSGPMNDERTIAEIGKMDAVQLNMSSERQITTPGGETMKVVDWSDRLGLFHAPTLLFFDEKGSEIMRVDSVVQFYRLWGVLDYINRKGYEESDYQTWRLGQRELSPAD